jgi:hypothetical protein
MRSRPFLPHRLATLAVAGLVLGLWGAVGVAEDYTLEKINAAPEDLSDAVAAQVDPAGVRINGPQRPKFDLWLLKSLPVAADFQPSSAIRYPFTPGQLLGVMQVPRRAELTDFRGNEIEAGSYTLRYGRQPMDGNHIGTSDLADFLVAIPTGDDESPDTIADPAKLHELSAGASGTTHPAIFSLQPVEKAGKDAMLTHDEAREFWILQLNASAKKGDKAESVPLRLVVVGIAEG